MDKEFYMENPEFVNAGDDGQLSADERRKRLHERVEATRPVLEYRAADRANHIRIMIDRVTSD